MIGSSVARVEGFAKVTGQALYTHDLKPEGCLYGWLVGASIAHGSIESIDLQEAERSPGVHLVLTHLNRGPLGSIPGPLKGVLVDNQRAPLADDRVLFYGQPVALVVAETLEQARQAALRLVINYRPQAHQVSRSVAQASSFRPKSQMGTPLTVQRGSVEHGLTVARAQISATYHTAIEHPCALEPHATLAEWQGDRLLVQDSTQWLIASHTVLASTFQGTAIKLKVVAGLGSGILGFGQPRGPGDKVRVRAPFIGGMFGSKALVGAHVILTALAARMLQRPVKTSLTRSQVLTAVGPRPTTEQTITLGATREGFLTAFRHEIWNHTSLEDDVIESGNMVSRLLYACPNYQTSHELSRLHLAKPSWMRAPGEMPGLFAIESAMDELALELEMDPLELRKRNHTLVNAHTKKPFSANHLLQCYERGAYQFGWSERSHQPGSMRQGDELIGWGMASCFFPALAMGAAVRLRLLEEDGKAIARISTAGVEVGTGMTTLLAMGVAEGLQLPLDQVRVDLGDSYSSYCSVAGGSNLTASLMPAVSQACDRMRKLLADKAKVRPRNLFDVDWSRLSGLIPAVGLECHGRTSPKMGGRYTYASFGAHFIEVRVHADLGRIRVSRVVSVFDVGRIMNARTARSQLVGGIVFGLGAALLEGLHLDPRQGRYVNADLAGYLVPVQADVPTIDVSWINEPDTHFNKLGAKGLGEIGITGVAPAIANAIHHATGKRLRSLPMGMRDLVETEVTKVNI